MRALTYDQGLYPGDRPALLIGSVLKRIRQPYRLDVIIVVQEIN